jgi:hypothetical protein
VETEMQLQPEGKKMQALPEASITTLPDLDASIPHLQYLADFLMQFTRSSESLNLHQVAYFLSMAAIETNELLQKLNAAARADLAKDLVNLAA